MQGSSPRYSTIGPGADLAAHAAADGASTEQALRDALERLEALHRHVASTPLALVEWSGDYRVTGYSPRAQELFGFSPEEVLGKRIDEIPWVPEPDWPLVRRVMAEMWTAERPTNVNVNRNLRKDGTVLHCEWYNSALYDASGRLRSMLSLVLDVTDRVRADEALRESEARTREAMARAEQVARFPRENPDPVLRLGADLVVSYTNAAAAALGARVGEPVPPELAGALARAQFVGGRASAEIARGGAVFSARFAQVGAEISVYAQDITGRKETERVLGETAAALADANARLREADRRKDEFLAMLSHELRNPLAPVRYALTVLERIGSPDPAAARARAVIARQIDHMTRLVGDLLDVTRVSRGKFELRCAPLDLAEVAARAAEDHGALLAARDLRLEVDLPAAPAWVSGDATRLTQAIGNLIQNAAKFSPRGRTVRIAVEARADAVELSVSDQGVGIEPALLERIFDPFVQADQSLARTGGGLGLGLALVRGIVELHGGAVHAESAGPGTGACIRMRLPPGLPPAEEGGAPAASPEVRRCRVLVVDDNRDGADSLAELVRMLGHEAEVAYDGPSALRLAARFGAEVVLCDLGLPGMDGFEVARRLAAAPTGRPRLVALTGYSQPRDVEAALAAGFDAHVAKPASIEAIQRVLEP